MIQRIQTLWMAVTVALMCVVLFAPVVWSGALAASALPLCAGAAAGIAAFLSFVAIFLYKKRRLQIRLLAVGFVLILAAAGTLGWYIWTTYSGEGVLLSSDFWCSFYPVFIAAAALLTNWLALRGVKKDDKLVRSVDRIR